MAATKKLLKAGGGKLRFEGPPWNDNTVDVIRTARAHSLYVLHKTFGDSVHQLQVRGPWPADSTAHLGRLGLLQELVMQALVQGGC